MQIDNYPFFIELYVKLYFKFWTYHSTFRGPHPHDLPIEAQKYSQG